ncbi:unnamed protein product [Linum trigynum]|uniref:Uncharacterized protein n=1 Tax=Linum trigynum TaxID=586398 RepID=A0AAV2GNS1_9ROSI
MYVANRGDRGTKLRFWSKRQQRRQTRLDPPQLLRLDARASCHSGGGVAIRVVVDSALRISVGLEDA